MPKKYYQRSPNNEAGDKRPAKALELWKHGLSKTVIRQRLGCSEKALRGWLSNAGAKPEVRQRWGGDEGGDHGHQIPAHMGSDYESGYRD